MIAAATTAAKLTITLVRSAAPSKISAPDGDYSVRFWWCVCCTSLLHPPEKSYDSSRSACNRCCVVVRGRRIRAGEQHERSSEATYVYAGATLRGVITTRFVNEPRLEPRIDTGATAAATSTCANASARCTCAGVWRHDERAVWSFRISWRECITVPARGRQCGCLHAPRRQRRTVAHTRSGQSGESLRTSARSSSSSRSSESTTTDSLVHR